MGQAKDVAKPEGEKKPPPASDDGPAVTSVYNINLHCEGCAKKVRHAVRHLDGVKQVKTDCGASKLTVVGKGDPDKVRERLEQKIKKKVELISPNPNKDASAGDMKPAVKKPDGNKSEDKIPEKKAKEATIVVKIRKMIMKINGVYFDGARDLVNAKKLKEKLKRTVEVPPPQNDGEKKGKETVAASDVVSKVELNKMDHYGHQNPPPMYWYDGHVYDQHLQYGQGHVAQGSESYVDMSMNRGHMAQGHEGYFDMNMNMNPRYEENEYVMPHHLHAPQMFSDENPNGCSVM